MVDIVIANDQTIADLTTPLAQQLANAFVGFNNPPVAQGVQNPMVPLIQQQVAAQNQLPQPPAIGRFTARLLTERQDQQRLQQMYRGI